MKITYDPEADALYIELREAQPADSIDIEEGVTAVRHGGERCPSYDATQ